MDSTLTVLYDGWDLAYRPNSPAAIHLLTLLGNRPEQVQAIIALPDNPYFPLPDGVRAHLHATSESDPGLLRWEQFSLPGLTRKLGAALLHLAAPRPALFRGVPTIVSPTGFRAQDGRVSRGEYASSILARLREAMAEGGMARARGLLWPDDLPAPDSPLLLRRLPPAVHQAFASDRKDPGLLKRLALPESYLLYHGPHHPAALRWMAEAWSWAAQSIGDYHPLLLLGIDPTLQAQLHLLVDEFRSEFHLGDTLRALPVLSIDEMAALYQGCSALFHPAEISPWGGPVRLALTCGKPIVALETALADALVGPAAYLVSGDLAAAETRRNLGAALITVVVEERVAESLSKAARQRASAWVNAHFNRGLLAGYRSLLALQ